MATSIDQGERVLPVFIINNELPGFEKKQFSTAELCAAAEKVTGYNSIEGAQRIGGLWRVYPRQKEAREKLLMKGFALRGVQVDVKAQNPFVVRAPNSVDADGREEQPPSTKLIIGNIPLSFSDTELLQRVKQLGVTIFSKLIPERDRDENGKLTHWKTGRRFLYIEVPNVPLPRSVDIGPFKASLYHREQKTAQRQQEAECRRCLQKGHQAGDCINPIKCRQCLNDGHKAGDPVCDMVAKGDNGKESRQDKTDKTRHDSKTENLTQKGQITNYSSDSGHKDSSQTNDTEKKNTTDIKHSNRSRQRSRQTNLKAFRREGSGSVKRPHSKGPISSPADKQARVSRDPSAGESDNESQDCETGGHNMD